MEEAQRMAELGELLDAAWRGDDDGALRAVLLAASGLPGPRLNLRLVDAFADAVGAAVAGFESPPESMVDAVERLLDGWAALDPDDAPGDQPGVILPCAAVAAYGAVGVARPEWSEDELGKLRRAASDARWRVREVVAQALQRLLDADWPPVVSVLAEWAAADDPLVVRAAAAAVAEPRLLAHVDRATSAHGVQRIAVDRYARDRRPRRVEASRVLRQGLGYTLSVPVAATGDFSLLQELAASDDPDLRWIATQNLKKSRLAARWPEQVARTQDLLADR